MKAGDLAGEAVYSLNDTEIKRVPLYYSASVEPLQVKDSSGGMWTAVRGLWTKLLDKTSS